MFVACRLDVRAGGEAGTSRLASNRETVSERVPSGPQCTPSRTQEREVGNQRNESSNEDSRETRRKRARHGSRVGPHSIRRCALPPLLGAGETGRDPSRMFTMLLVPEYVPEREGRVLFGELGICLNIFFSAASHYERHRAVP